MRICYVEEDDQEFIRWSANLLHRFLAEGSLTLVGRHQSPDAMIASIWRPHAFPEDIPVILITNESWRVFPPHAPLSRYKAVLGLYPPEQPCSFIQFPYAATHFELSLDALYAARPRALSIPKTKFCCFVVSNMAGPLSRKRVELFERINAWQRVDSAGLVANNMQACAPRGTDFLCWIAQYKYMICLENDDQPGYITEKPFQPWFAGTVPIYAGGCAARLNQKAIINASTEDVLAALAALEGDSAAYEEKRRAELMTPRLSLEAFEENFRRTVLLPQLA